jgi:hypothetical protein
MKEGCVEALIQEWGLSISWTVGRVPNNCVLDSVLF